MLTLRGPARVLKLDPDQELHRVGKSSTLTSTELAGSRRPARRVASTHNGARRGTRAPSPATPGAIPCPRDRRLLAVGGFEGELGVELDPSADHHLEWLPGADTELVAVKLAADVQDEVTAVAPV